VDREEGKEREREGDLIEGARQTPQYGAGPSGKRLTELKYDSKLLFRNDSIG
jgi:hypothetical protein